MHDFGNTTLSPPRANPSPAYRENSEPAVEEQIPANRPTQLTGYVDLTRLNGSLNQISFSLPGFSSAINAASMDEPITGFLFTFDRETGNLSISANSDDAPLPRLTNPLDDASQATPEKRTELERSIPENHLLLIFSDGEERTIPIVDAEMLGLYSELMEDQDDDSTGENRTYEVSKFSGKEFDEIHTTLKTFSKRPAYSMAETFDEQIVLTMLNFCHFFHPVKLEKACIHWLFSQYSHIQASNDPEQFEHFLLCFIAAAPSYLSQDQETMGNREQEAVKPQPCLLKQILIMALPTASNDQIKRLYHQLHNKHAQPELRTSLKSLSKAIPQGEQFPVNKLHRILEQNCVDALETLLDSPDGQSIKKRLQQKPHLNGVFPSYCQPRNSRFNNGRDNPLCVAINIALQRPRQEPNHAIIRTLLDYLSPTDSDCLVRDTLSSHKGQALARYAAASHHGLPTLKLLIDKGADIIGSGALISACEHGREDTVNFLINDLGAYTPVWISPKSALPTSGQNQVAIKAEENQFTLIFFEYSGAGSREPYRINNEHPLYQNLLAAYNSPTVRNNPKEVKELVDQITTVLNHQPLGLLSTMSIAEQCMALAEAARGGCLPICKKLVDLGVPIQYPLPVESAERRTAEQNRLMQNSELRNARVPGSHFPEYYIDNVNPLVQAVAAKDHLLAEYLLYAGADPHSVQTLYLNQSHTMDAAMSQEVKCADNPSWFKYLIGNQYRLQNITVNSYDAHQDHNAEQYEVIRHQSSEQVCRFRVLKKRITTPLMLAVATQQTGLAALMLNNGASPLLALDDDHCSYPRNALYTAIILAITTNNLDPLRLIMASDPQVLHGLEPEMSGRLLLAVAHKGNTDLIRLLTEDPLSAFNQSKAKKQRTPTNIHYKSSNLTTYGLYKKRADEPDPGLLKRLHPGLKNQVFEGLRSL